MAENEAEIKDEMTSQEFWARPKCKRCGMPDIYRKHDPDSFFYHPFEPNGGAK